MSDLISRQKVIELIESKFVDGALMENDKTMIDGYGLLDEVSEIPTDYNVEKVVEQLEEEQEKLETDMWARESNNWHGQLCNGMSDGLETAISVVKAGGVNE